MNLHGPPASIFAFEVETMTRSSPVTKYILLIAAMVLVFGHFSCDADNDAETSGESIRFQTGVVGSPDAAAFTNDKGWAVELSKAEMVVGPIYFYSSTPLARLFKRLFSPRLAYACPAHAQYDKGTVLGEVLKQYVVDLLDDGVTFTGASDGQKGRCRMFELHIHPPGEIEAGSAEGEFERLSGFSIHVEGEAAKDDAIAPFEGYLTIPDEGTMRVVENIGADMELKDGSTAVVRVLAEAWFANVDFDSLVEQNEQGRYEITENTQAYNAWLTGVRSRYSYEAYTEPLK